ncbi:unnamed protein product, partial [Allacma fusca]
CNDGVLILTFRLQKLPQF